MGIDFKEAARRKAEKRAAAAKGGGKKAPAAGFDYGRARKDREAGDRSDYFNFKPGKTRCMMTLGVGQSADTFYVRQSRFWVPGAGKNKQGKATKGMFIVSPRSLDADAPCIATAIFEALSKDTRPRVKALVDRNSKEAMGQRDRWFSNLFVEEGGAFAHKIGQYPYTVFKGVMDAVQAEIDEDDIDADGIVADPPIVGSKPRLMVITRTDGARTEYNVAVTAKVVILSAEQKAKRIDLFDQLTPTSEEDARAALCEFLQTDDLDAVIAGDWSPGGGRIDREDADAGIDAEEDEAPKAKRKAAPSAGKKKPAPAAEEEDEDEEYPEGLADDEEEEAEEEEEEAPKPMPSAKKKKAAPAPEPEEDAGDDPDVPECFGEYPNGNEPEAKALRQKRGCKACVYKPHCKDTEAVSE